MMKNRYLFFLILMSGNVQSMEFEAQTSLPLEIWSRIISFLDVQDRNAVRAACKSLGALSTRKNNACLPPLECADNFSAKEKKCLIKFYAKENNVAGVTRFLDLGATDIQGALLSAVKDNNNVSQSALILANRWQQHVTLSSLGVKDLLYYVGKGGHRTVAEVLVEKLGTPCVKYIFRGAAAGYFTGYVRELLTTWGEQLTSEDCRVAQMNAAAAGKIANIQLLYECDADATEDVFYTSLKYGRREVLNYLFDTGKTKDISRSILYNALLEFLNYPCDSEILSLVFEKMSARIDGSIANLMLETVAQSHYNIAVLKYLLRDETCITDPNPALRVATMRNNWKIVQEILKHSAVSNAGIQEALEIARLLNDETIITMLEGALELIAEENVEGNIYDDDSLSTDELEESASGSELDLADIPGEAIVDINGILLFNYSSSATEEEEEEGEELEQPELVRLPKRRSGLCILV